MSGFRSEKSKPGAKAAGGGSTHTSNAKPLAESGAKASGGPHGVSTHEHLSGARKVAGAGAKASQRGNNSLVQQPGDGYPSGPERVTEHHRK